MIWHCMNATRNGIKNCPHCKAIDETILEDSFLEAFQLLAGNFDDVLESRKSKVTDMLIDGIITKDAYGEKVNMILRKLNELESKKKILVEVVNDEREDVTKEHDLKMCSLGNDEAEEMCSLEDERIRYEKK